MSDLRRKPGFVEHGCISCKKCPVLHCSICYECPTPVKLVGKSPTIASGTIQQGALQVGKLNPVGIAAMFGVSLKEAEEYCERKAKGL